MVTPKKNGKIDPELQFQRFTELVGNVMSARSDMFRQMFDPRRNIDDECGYPRTNGWIQPQLYQDLYDREAVATRVVEVWSKESWQVSPMVYEDERSNKVTEFEAAWDNLGRSLKGEDKYYQDEEGSPIWEYLMRADILSGIGQYGVILLGLNDGKPLDTPAYEPSLPDSVGMFSPGSQGTDAQYFRQFSTVPQPNGTPSNGTKRKSKGLQLTFVRVFPESLLQITQYESNVNNPRFGQPVMYLVTFNDPREQNTGVGLPLAQANVHWTRVVHIADVHHTASSSEVLAKPRMFPVLNRLLDVRKLYSGSAEMYWRGAFPGLSLETHPQLGGDVEINKQDLRDQMENWGNGLQRYLALMGISAKMLSPTVVDPSAQINVQLEAICIKLAIPKRVFIGSERGELASSQDDAAWNDRLKQRQNGYVTPRIIRPFVSRLIRLGVLPEPGGYSVEWPDLTSRTDQEKAQVAVARTGALAQYVGGNVEAVIPPMEYLTKILDMDEEEAAAILESAAALAEEREEEADLKAKEMSAMGLGPDGKPLPKQEPAEDEEDSEESGVTNVFCATGPGGGVDPSCSPGGSLAREAKGAWSKNDQKTLDKIKADVKAAGSKRGGLGVKGLKEMAKGLGIKGYSSLNKAGVAQAIQDKLSVLSKSAPEAERTDRMERVSLAEKHTGVKFTDRVINGVIAHSTEGKSDKYRTALADLARNGTSAKAANMTYVRAVRENASRSIKEDTVDQNALRNTLQGISEEGKGTMSMQEFQEHLHGARVEAPKPTNILPDELRLAPAPRGGRTLYKESRKQREPDYADHIREPQKDRLSKVKEIETETKIPFAARVIHGLAENPKVDLPGKDAYFAKAAIQSAGGRLSEEDLRGMSGFRASVVAKIKLGDISDVHIVDALEKIDSIGRGTMKLAEFTKSLTKRRAG